MYIDMKRLFNFRMMTFIGALWLASGSALLADSDHDRARQLQQAGDILPLEKILENAQATHPGRIIEVELEKEHGRYIYEIESVDESGHVREMKFDARTGALLSSEMDD